MNDQNLEHAVSRLKYQVPQKFWKQSRIDSYRALVLEAWNRPVNCYQTQQGELREFPESAHCTIGGSGGAREVLVPKGTLPHLHDASLLFGKISFDIKPWSQRYITLYKAYECLTDDRKEEFSAIRHGLSHPGRKLTHKKTIGALTEIFGTTEIELKEYRHQKKFFCYFGKLLMELDQLLFSSVVRSLPKEKNLADIYYLLDGKG